MANPEKAVQENVAGEFFVDATCIDCGTCRHLAPRSFDEAAEYSFVYRQPQTGEETQAALHALLSCPTGSIGTRHANDARSAINDFPLPIAENVFYCGFTSPKSYGASSYFIAHAAGNWLVDVPKYLPHLVSELEARGGVARIFLTHSDDVGDADQYAKHFHAKRIMHREEIWSQPETEIIIDGVDPVPVAPGFTVIPVPGHTKGSCVLHYNNRFLFTGDHMWWDPKMERLSNPTYYYWNTREMARSNEKLHDLPFEWVLPGHGHPVHLPAAEMQEKLQALLNKVAYS